MACVVCCYLFHATALYRSGISNRRIPSTVCWYYCFVERVDTGQPAWFVLWHRPKVEYGNGAGNNGAGNNRTGIRGAGNNGAGINMGWREYPSPLSVRFQPNPIQFGEPCLKIHSPHGCPAILPHNSKRLTVHIPTEMPLKSGRYDRHALASRLQVPEFLDRVQSVVNSTLKNLAIQRRLERRPSALRV